MLTRKERTSPSLGICPDERGNVDPAAVVMVTSVPVGGAQAPNIPVPAFISRTMDAPGPAAGAIVSFGIKLIVLPLPDSIETRRCRALTAEAVTVPGLPHELAV